MQSESQPAAAAMDALRRDVDRAARHSGFSAWDALVIESEHGVLGLAPDERAAGGLAVAVCESGTPPGYVRRVLARMTAGPDGPGV